MTCIVALATDDDLFFGADGIYTATERKRPSLTSKLINVNNRMIIGVSGHVRMINILRSDADRFTFDTDLKGEEFITNWFIPQLMKVLEDNYYLVDCNQGREIKQSVLMLVGYDGNIYRIDDDFAVFQSGYHFDAVGTGDDIVLGTLYGLWKSKTDMPASLQVLTALRAASLFNTKVGPPFEIWHLADNKITKEYATS